MPTLADLFSRTAFRKGADRSIEVGGGGPVSIAAFEASVVSPLTDFAFGDSFITNDPDTFGVTFDADELLTVLPGVYIVNARILASDDPDPDLTEIDFFSGDGNDFGTALIGEYGGAEQGIVAYTVVTLYATELNLKVTYNGEGTPTFTARGSVTRVGDYVGEDLNP